MTTKCYRCKRKLTEADPHRNHKGERKFTGYCKQCSSDKIVLRKWNARGKRATMRQVKKLRRQANLLEGLFK